LQKTARRFEIPGRTLHWFTSVDSTMTIAVDLAREGCAHGTTVVADEQTAGIGRHGHSWHSQPGGLYVSIVLRLPRPLPVMMLALGLAARDAIVSTLGGAGHRPGAPMLNNALQPCGAGLRPAHPAPTEARLREGTVDLRWPNDVLIGGLKCAGILAQREGGAVIAGIGINVSQTEFPDGLEATSLLLAGATATRENVLRTLVDAVDRYCAAEPAEIRRMFEAASSYARGLRVRVEQDGVEGVTQGLDASGFLIVRQDNGQDATILAGGVRPCS
jgi:BirA family biotin operon repressor/biotin-[acetyl-CoA-carboxylase] ligase